MRDKVSSESQATRYIIYLSLIFEVNFLASLSKFMDTKKYVIGVGLIASMLIAGSSMVLAQSTAVAMPQIEHKMVVEIGPSGRTLLRGTVGAVAANSLTVKSWGGDWVVNVGAGTKLTPGNDIAQFQVGDFVGVQGVTSQSALWTIDATLVRNWSIRQVWLDAKKEVKELIRSVMPRNWQGVVVGDVNADGSFKLKIGEKTYDIKLAANAMVVNQKYMAIASSQIKTGDTVRVYGPATETSITASVVRDVSIMP